MIAGEDPQTDDPQAAHNWLGLYSELVAFHEELLQQLRTEGAHMQTTRHRLQDSDLAGLLREIARLRERLAFWQQRALDLAGIEIDEDARVLRSGEREVQLTRREMELLAVMLRNPGRRYRPEALLSLAWRENRLAPEQLRTYIVRLRRKLAQAEVPAVLETHPRQGYALTID
ncbi:MAG TPA: winged helix-turn-helix domain-containing protein [Candidatus Dormibacteraeota bacterium]